MVDCSYTPANIAHLITEEFGMKMSWQTVLHCSCAVGLHVHSPCQQEQPKEKKRSGFVNWHIV